MARKLNRNAGFGEICGEPSASLGYARYVQDGIYFDEQGNEIQLDLDGDGKPDQQEAAAPKNRGGRPPKPKTEPAAAPAAPDQIGQQLSGE